MDIENLGLGSIVFKTKGLGSGVAWEVIDLDKFVCGETIRLQCISEPGVTWSGLKADVAEVFSREGISVNDLGYSREQLAFITASVDASQAGHTFIEKVRSPGRALERAASQQNAASFFLTTLNSIDDATPRLVAQEIARGEMESFAARFINGIVQQAHVQTGHERPIGETTAVRIAGDLFALINAISGVEAKYDYAKVRNQLRLDFLNSDNHRISQ